MKKLFLMLLMAMVGVSLMGVELKFDADPQSGIVQWQLLNDDDDDDDDDDDWDDEDEDEDEDDDEEDDEDDDEDEDEDDDDDF